jgi:hypothetical protein
MPGKARIARRKPQNHKGCTSVAKKTLRRELRPCERAFAVGACIVGRSTQEEEAAYFPNAGGQSTIQKVLSTVVKRAKEQNIPITSPSLYEDLPHSGRPELLTPRQKRAIIKIVTKDRAHREKEPFQAIADGDFKDIVPQMSITTFENVMYEAGYSRKKPGWKPPLTAKEEQERYQWALAHNPDLHCIGDGQGFNFRTVAYTDETPARIGEQRGMQRTWIRDGEQYDEGVKKDRILKYSQLQFYLRYL